MIARFRQAIASLKTHTPNALQLAGLTTFTAGCFVITTWLGLMVAGALLCLVGWAVDD